MASGDAIEQIKERLSIVDVVSTYVELHKAGKNYKGKSPFTSEKTPSFYVSPDKGMYYCFSSSQGGDIFTFVQTMEGVDFKGALAILAERAGVELVPEDPKKRTERETGFNILDEACTFFQKKLQGTTEATAYLKDRGVSTETIAKWRIGYAPGPPKGGWREVRNFLKEQKHTDTELLKAGLVKSAEAGKEPYDVFRDRVMFPIFDASGKVIAFSGRILTKDSDAPKYVNSPETDFFNKSEVLYGYDKAKQGIRQFDFSLIVEGQFDVVLAHQAGYTNTVAVSGTALTNYHVGLLQRLSNRVVLALDADRAGIAAVRRAADIMLARGIDLKVARLPEGEDPADIVRKDVKQFKDIIGHATHVIEFLLAVLKEESKDARTYKLRVRDEVLPYIARMQNHIDADHFSSVVAAAIETSKDAVLLEMSRLREEAASSRRVRDVINDSPSNSVAEKPKVISTRKDELIAYLVVASELVPSDVQEVVECMFNEITGMTTKVCTETLGMEKQSEFLFKLQSQFDVLGERQLKDEIASKLHELRLLYVREALREKKELLYASEQSGDAAASESLMNEIVELQKRLGEASMPTNPFDPESDEED